MDKLSIIGWIILINLWLTTVSSLSEDNHHKLVDQLSKLLFNNAEHVLQAFEDDHKLPKDYYEVFLRMKIHSLDLIYTNQRAKIHKFQLHQVNAVKPDSFVQVGQNVKQIKASFVRGNYMVTPPRLHLPGPMLGYWESMSFIGRTSNQATAIRGHLQNIKYRLKDVVFLNRDAKIPGRINFRSRIGLGNLRCLQADIRNASAFNYIIDGLATRNEYPSTIPGWLYFKSGISAQALHSNTLNGLDPLRWFVLKRAGKVSIRSPVRIAALTTSKDVHSSLINRGYVSDFVFINGPPQSIASPMNFIRDMTVSHTLDLQYLSGFNVRSLGRSILTSYGDQDISSPVSAHTTMAPTIVLRANLNGLPFQKRIQRLVQSNKPINVRGLTLSSNWIRVENLHTNNLNGFRVPDDFLISSRSASQRISGVKNFRSLHIDQGETRIRGLVNRMKYPSSFVTLDGNETIESNIEFNNNVVFNRDILTTGRLGRLKISNLIAWASDRDFWSINSQNNPRGKVYVYGNLDVKHHINGINLASLLNDSVHLGETRLVQVSGAKVFASPLSAPTITIKVLNDQPLSTFVKANHQAISSPLRFTKPLTIGNLNWDNGQRYRNDILNLTHQRISLFHAGPIYGDLNLEDVNIGRYMFVKGRLNTIWPRSLVVRSRPQTISGPKTFLRGVTFAQPLVSNRALIKYRLNNFPMIQLQNSQSRFGRKELSFRKMVILGATIGQLYPGPSGDLRVNNISLIHSLKNILLKNGDQTISGRKKFLRPVELNHGHSNSATRYGKLARGLFLYPSINFSLPQHLLNLEITGNVKAHGRVNNMNLRNLLDLQAYSPDWYTMTGSQSFARGFIGNVLTFERLNGVDFKKYLLKNAQQQIIFPLHARDVKIHGNILIDGLVNKNNFSSTVREIMAPKLSNQAVIRGPVVFKRPVKVYHNLNVTGSINKVDFDWFTRDLVAPGSSQFISGTKSIQGAYLKKNLIVGKLNGSPLNAQLNDIVLLKTKAALLLPQSIDFRNSLLIRDNLIQSNGRIDFTRLVNGISVNNLVKNAIWFQSQQRVPTNIHFVDPIEIRSSKPILIAGRVNGLDLTRDILWLRSIFRPYQVITSRKRFSNVQFNGDVTILGEFNGRTWTSRLRDVIENRPQNILGHTRLGGQVRLWQGASILNIDGKSGDFVPVESSFPIPITGKWRFTNTIQIDQDIIVHGKIKNIDLLDLARNSLRKSKSQILVHPIRFERVYLSDGSVIKPLMNEVRDLKRSFADQWNSSLVRQIDQLNTQVGRNLFTNNALIRMAETAPLNLHGFRIFQKLSGIIGNFVNLHSPDSFSIGTVNRDISLASVSHFVFNGRKNAFMISESSTSTPFVDSQRFTLGGKSYVLFQAACNSVNQSIITTGGQLIANLGLYYDDVKILSLNSNAKIISALSSVRGVVETFTIGIVNQRLFFRQISTLTVTPSARKISLFQINGEIYLAVARSGTSVCEVEESGSLLFHWLAKKSFNLIQRFTNFEASNVDSYTFNTHHYLVFSDDRDQDDRLGSKGIHIFKSYFPHWPKCQFKHFQSLNFEQTRDMKAFQVPSLGSPIQLFAALNQRSLQIWQQAGNAGFKEIWQAQLSQAEAFKFFIFKQKVLLIVAQLNRRAGSFILEAII